MANYKPPRENESSAEFWQRLREMAKTLEQDNASHRAASRSPVLH